VGSDDHHPREEDALKASAFERKRSAGPYVAAKLREIDAVLALAIPRVVGHLDDEAIHDLRVAIRRMRTLLKMARPIFGRFHADAVRKAFTDVMRATGELRDLEVLLGTIEGVSESAAFMDWRRSCQAREKKLRAAVTAAIERGELDGARSMLSALLAFPFDPSRAMSLSRFARRTVGRARRAVERNRGVDPHDSVGLHSLRIACKELRYSIELLFDALPGDAKAMLEPCTIVQDRLGAIHDVEVAIHALKRVRGLRREARRESLASLATQRARRVSDYLRDVDRLR
jgi:CHAD domain-containing protein